jgi:hypothetical protein
MSLPWVNSDENLPPFNRRVLAFMLGTKNHSGLNWKRSGFAQMLLRDDGGVHLKRGEWDSFLYREACINLDADDMNVTHWFLLEEPDALQTQEQGS